MTPQEKQLVASQKAWAETAATIRKFHLANPVVDMRDIVAYTKKDVCQPFEDLRLGGYFTSNTILLEDPDHPGVWWKYHKLWDSTTFRDLVTLTLQLGPGWSVCHVPFFIQGNVGCGIVTRRFNSGSLVSILDQYVKELTDKPGSD